MKLHGRAAMLIAALAAFGGAEIWNGAPAGAEPTPAPSASVPPVLPSLAPVATPEGFGFGDPGPSLIERATGVEHATYPGLPTLPAPDIVPPAGTLERASAIVGVGQRPFVAIALPDAIAMALARNTNLALSQANRRVVRYAIVADEGAYDVHFQVQPSYEHNVQPAISPFASNSEGGPITQDILDVSATFSGLLPSGATYSANLGGQRVTTDNASSSYDPYYPTTASLSLTQPLLRNRDIDAARRQLLTDRYTLDIDTDAALASAETTIDSVANAYWSLVYAWQHVAVQEAALRQAQLQAASNARRVVHGRLAASDVAEANAQVSAFQGQVSLALQTVQQQQLELKTLLLGNPADAIWKANLVPVTAPEGVVPEPDLDASLVRALHDRPELAELIAQRRVAGVQIRYARDQLKPQLDITGTLIPQGLAGVPTAPQADELLFGITQQTIAIDKLIANANLGLLASSQIASLPLPDLSLPPNQNGSFGTSVARLLSGRYPTYIAQATLGIPIGNRIARGDFDEAVEQDRALQVQQVALVQSIQSDAASAIEMLRTDAALLASARDDRQAIQSVYASEVRRRAVGRSTTFLVLQRLVALADARDSELQAQSNYNRALAFFHETTGESLSDAGVDVRKVGATTLDRTQGPPAVTKVSPP